jgi:hypothetical protein
MSSHHLVALLSLAVAGPVVASNAAGKKAEAMKTVEKKVTEKGIGMLASVPEKSVAGAAVDLKITFQNRRQQGISILAGIITAANFELQVLDSKGQPVPLTRFGKQAENIRKAGSSAAPIPVAAGKDQEFHVNLARLFDLTLEGDYTLNVRRVVEGVSLKIEGLPFSIQEGG